MMREIETRSLAPVLAVLMLFILSVPASAGDIEGFSSWAERRCGEIDRQWERASSDVMGTEGSLVTAAYNADDHSSLPEGARINGRTVPVQNRPLSGSANPIFHSSMETGGRFLWRTSRERGAPSRGTLSLSSPADARLGITPNRRLPFKPAGKYSRSAGFGLRGRFRRSPRMGQRISASRSRRTRASSLTRGATRVRRSARSTR